MKEVDVSSLEHTSWRCQYHVVFALKYKAYIQNQLEEDKMSDQISIKEFIDPFTGSKNPKAQIKPLKGFVRNRPL